MILIVVSLINKRTENKTVINRDQPVFPTDRGWQPAQISFWWWCICWNETPSPAPISDGLCTLPCTSPSSLSYLWRWKNKKHSHEEVVCPFLGSSACSQVVELEGFPPRSRLHARTGLSTHSIFISCVFNTHVSVFSTDTQLQLFDLALMTAVVRWISKNDESVPPRDTGKTSEEPVGSTQFILRKHPNYCPNVGYCYLKWLYTFPGTNVCVIGLMEEWKKQQQLKETSKLSMNSAKRFKLMSGYYFFFKNTPIWHG